MTRIRKAVIAWSALCVVWLLFVASRDQFDKGAAVRNVALSCVAGLGVIAFIWFVTRGRGRDCPHCGQDVTKGITVCSNCGYDFALGGNPTSGPAPAVGAESAPVASVAPAGWYDDSAREGHKRWWDGTAWGIKDDEHPVTTSVTPPRGG